VSYGHSNNPDPSVKIQSIWDRAELAMKRAEKFRIWKHTSHFPWVQLTAQWMRVARTENDGPWHPFKKFGVVVFNYSMSNPYSPAST